VHEGETVSDTRPSVIQLLSNSMKVLVYDQESEDRLKRFITDATAQHCGNSEFTDRLALVIDGSALLYALEPG